MKIPPAVADTRSKGQREVGCCLFIHTVVCEHISSMVACVSTFKHYYLQSEQEVGLKQWKYIVPLVIGIINVVFAHVVGWGWSDGKVPVFCLHRFAESNLSQID